MDKSLNNEGIVILLLWKTKAIKKINIPKELQDTF